MPNLTDDEKARILWDNGLAFLGIDAKRFVGEPQPTANNDLDPKAEVDFPRQP